MKLLGKTALVTGASRGIGREIALELARNGADVAVNYAGSRDLAEEVCREIEAMGRKAFSVQADVKNPGDVEAMFKDVIGRFGSLHILVNNAGITRDTLVLRMKEEDWDEVIETNLKGAFLCTKQAARQMMKQRYGRIINISSIVGERGNVGQANYVSAKAGLIGLTKASALELAARGITVNAVAPGFIQTDMTDRLPEEVREAMLKQIPLARFGETKDVAKTVLFLASDDAAYITGQTIHVNGGMYM